MQVVFAKFSADYDEFCFFWVNDFIAKNYDKIIAMENIFLDWMTIKDAINRTNAITKFSEGQIWWAALGKNVGVEINGKHKDFSRPVIIFKKLSHQCFLAIPLTSQPHSGTWYAEFNFKGKQEYAVLSQIRMMSVSRLYNRMGKLSASDFKKIQTGFKKLIK